MKIAKNLSSIHDGIKVMGSLHPVLALVTWASKNLSRYHWGKKWYSGTNQNYSVASIYRQLKKNVDNQPIHFYLISLFKQNFTVNKKFSNYFFDFRTKPMQI